MEYSGLKKIMKRINMRTFEKMNGKVGDIASITRLLRKTPTLVSLLGLLVLMLIIFNSTGDLGGFRQHLKRVREQEKAEFSTGRSSLSDLRDNSIRSLKDLVKEAMDKGLVIIVNATRANADQLYADSPRGALAQWDGIAALDGPTGEILTEVIQELQNVEELQKEVATLRSRQHLCKTRAADKACGTKSQTFNERKSGEKGTSVARPIFQGDYKFRAFHLSVHPLILFSSYRVLPEQFSLVTLVANSLSEKMPMQADANAGTCIWLQWDASSNRTLKFPPPVDTDVPVQYGRRSNVFVNDPTKGGLPYDVALIKCTFEDPAGANGLGGHLYLKLGSGEFVPVFDEPPEAINRIQFEGPLRYSYAFCPPPISNRLNARYLKQWLMYNHHVFREGKLHYFIYHELDLDTEIMRVLQPFLDTGSLTLIDVRVDGSFIVGPRQYPCNLLALNDCLQRSRFLADWAFFWGFNEYLEILPPQTLLNVLESNKESPYITFGSQIWSSIYCSPCKNSTLATVDDEDWAVDRMFLRLEHPTCSDKSRSSTCVGPEGGRKWAANPRKVIAATTHYTLEPSWGGADLDTGIARLNLYTGGDSHGLSDFDSDKVNCLIILEPVLVNTSTAVDGYWWKDTSISATSQPAHDFVKTSTLFSFGSSSNTSAVEEGQHQC